MPNFADHTAAAAAGWNRVQRDMGATFPDQSSRYQTYYEHHLIGEPSSSGGQTRIQTASGISQADADTKALNALNGFRATRYGIGATPNVGSRGGALSFDVH